MDDFDAQCRNQRIAIRKERCKIRKRLVKIMPISGVMEIIIDYLCWNRRMIDTLHHIGLTTSNLSCGDIHIRGTFRWGDKNVVVVYQTKYDDRAAICNDVNDIVQYVDLTVLVPDKYRSGRAAILHMIHTYKK